MAHTMEHPFGGNDITSCSYGAQAVSKAAKTVSPKYLAKPKTQTDLSTMWMTKFAAQADGPVLRASKKIGDDTHITLVSKKNGELHVEYIKNNAPDGEFTGGVANVEKYLQGQASNYHLNGWDLEWKYAADAADGIGVTEAAFEAANATGSWQVAVAKAAKGELNKGDVVARGVDLNGNEWRLIYKGGNEWQPQSLLKNSSGVGGKWVGFDKNVFQLEADYFGPNAKWQNDIKWKWGNTKGSPPAVSPQSTSIGGMMDEDAAALFVQIKDDFATARGINIQGANKALDFAVYDKIAELTGYTPSEIFAKIERYKANGHKLSALKKKVLKKGQKIDATKYAKQETVEKAVKELSDPKVTDVLGIYADEDVAKAYIKAKDHVASLTENPWTLYTNETQVPGFEKAIRAYMKSEYGVDLPADQLKKQLANYISSDGKLSLLKKKMVKSGQMEKKADTLKSKFVTKAEQKTAEGDASSTVPHSSSVQMGPTPGASGQKYTAEQLADLQYKPPGMRFTTVSDDEIITQFNNNGGYWFVLNDSPESLYAKALKVTQELWAKDKKTSVMDVLRAWDRHKSSVLGVENKFLFEKKIAEWASTSSGQNSIMNTVKGFNSVTQMPALPADSAMFSIPSVADGFAFQSRVVSWTNAQKEALRHYTTSGGAASMNSAGRSGAQVYGNIKEKFRDAWKGMRPLDRPMLLTRGTSPTNIGLSRNASFEEIASKIGDTFADRGFTSASVDNGGFGGSIRLEIEAPIGTQASFLEGISHFKGGIEKEMLLAPNTHYKILRVEKRGGKTIVRCRVVHSVPYSDSAWRKYGYG